jgi:hypothetical protein
VNAVEADPAIEPGAKPGSLKPNGVLPFDLTITPSVLGPYSAKLRVLSNDTERSPHDVTIAWTGIPKPTPKIEVCTGEGTCGTDVTLDFGMVRRTQRGSRTVMVANRGTAPLTIHRVDLESRASANGELQVNTATRSGALPPGAEARLLVVYVPADGGSDSAVLSFGSDDPVTPHASVSISAASADNLPPVAAARLVTTSTVPQRIVIGTALYVDGSMSSDAEGDPLSFRWTLAAPGGSGAMLDSTTAVGVSFLPDVPGQYRVSLEVTDSLAQTSPAAEVTVDVGPTRRLLVELAWPAGGDVDLHLVPLDEGLFTPSDCYYANTVARLGDPFSQSDDPMLADDSTVAPGRESIGIVEPAPGVYQLYVQYFDDRGGQATDATVRVTFDDATSPANEQTRTLSSTCDLWYVGYAEFPQASFTPDTSATSRLCPPTR